MALDDDMQSGMNMNGIGGDGVGTKSRIEFDELHEQAALEQGLS
jgi:hypothetical protein